jgi:hypothetical protein
MEDVSSWRKGEQGGPKSVNVFFMIKKLDKVLCILSIEKLITIMNSLTVL